MKLPVLSGLDVIKKLKKCGFVATRQKGSHVRLGKSLRDETIKVTVPLHAELKKGTTELLKMPDSLLKSLWH